jgi:hypothetical protein
MTVITVDRAVLEQALGALETLVPRRGGDEYSRAAGALRKVLNQPDQIEPSAMPVKYEARRRNRFSGVWDEWSECPANTRAVLDSESVSDEWEVRALYTSPTS